MESSVLKIRVKEEAQRLGFDVCRIAPACPPPHAEAFLRWLHEGRAGDMLWLSKNAAKRVNPELVLPGARSIVIVAKNYTPEPTAKDNESSAPFAIARYARGADYHEVLTPRIRELEQVLASEGGLQRSYIDTGPVLEREYAALAGIGWQGKSTMLISKELGTFFFLGALLTTLELPPDPPATPHCGKCTRCLDACPTSAFTAPYHLDAQRCIAYLTIELKGSIPEPLRPLIGNRIYGCDDCAAICPWNRFAQASKESQFRAGPWAKTTQLRNFLSLNDEAFRTLFRESPIRRIKRRGFLRNVCVALGNTGTLEDVPALESASHDHEPLIVEHALWALAQIRLRLETSPPHASRSPARGSNLSRTFPL